ncbi:MAG: MBL fold metallo-hydrolase [Lachnospiraceae bacterium]|nr:MBL fold metallo-hydrolase [Lachnospiraceae bacterium]
MCNKIKKLLCLLLIAVLCLAGCTNEQPKESNQKERPVSESVEDTTEDTTDEALPNRLEVHFIDVGQGDAILILSGEHAMMIDFGNNNKGTLVQKYLMEHNVTTLDYAIGTHPDADHIGGMDVVLYKFDVKNVFMPDVEADTETYRDVLQVAKQKGLKIKQPKLAKVYSLGEDTDFQIIGPVEIDQSDKNSASIGIKLTHGKNSFIMCGDAPIEEEDDIIRTGVDLSADVLKLGHHGSATSTGSAFLKEVNPRSVVISCGEDNSYGHPHVEIMDMIQEKGLDCYRTDKQGTLIAFSDGESITWNVDPATDLSPGINSTGTSKFDKKSVPPKDMTKERSSEGEGTYILNINTKKIHTAGCSSVKSMKSGNRKETSESIEELEAKGYERCKNCLR